MVRNLDSAVDPCAWGFECYGLRNQVITDAHAPEVFRVATVRNLDAWFAAFDVKPGEKLYLAPPDRVRIW